MTKKEIPVRKHKRQLSTGETTSVKKHSRMIQQVTPQSIKGKLPRNPKIQKPKSKQPNNPPVTYKKNPQIKKSTIKISAIFNAETKQRFKDIVDIFQKNPDTNFEIGFGIDKEGNTTDLIFGETATIEVGGKSFTKFGEDLEFVIHTHPDLVEVGDLNVTERFFSVADLLNADLFGYTPVLMTRESFYDDNRKQKVRYSIKSLSNIPKDREKLVAEYGKIHTDFEEAQSNWKKKHNITSIWEYIDLPGEK